MLKSNITVSPVAKSVPFDNSTGRGLSSSDVQETLEELRDHTVYGSRTQDTTLNGTLTLTSSDVNLQYLTGTQTGYSVLLPNATTIPIGSFYQVINTTNQVVTIKDGNSGTLYSLSQNSVGYHYLQVGGSVNGTWIYFQILASSTASGIINYNLTSATPFATTSSTDVLITGMSITPQAGTYAIWYSSTNANTTNNSKNNVTLYKGGSSITDSNRTFQTGSSNMTFQLNTLTVTSCNGSQAIDVRVKTSTGTFTVDGRSLLLIRLGA
jgi:hypothetical protein